METRVFMEKLINGIIEFRKGLTGERRELFARLALGQQPDVLFIACSDSRVVPNLFASTNPGDLFVYRNIGNIVPAHHILGEESSKAALEFSLSALNIKDIVVCGHSECGAMMGVCHPEMIPEGCCSVKKWLEHAKEALEKVKQGNSLDRNLSFHNQVSQMNVLVQMEHILSYPQVLQSVEMGTLRVHGWWFDIAHADVYYYENHVNRFVMIEESVKEILLGSYTNPLSQAPALA